MVNSGSAEEKIQGHTTRIPCLYKQLPAWTQSPEQILLRWYLTASLAVKEDIHLG